MRKGLWCLLLIGLLVPLVAQQDRRPLPYQDDEFPLWAHKVRRFEIVLFGTIPITMLLGSLVLDGVENSVEGRGLLDPRPINGETLAAKIGVSLGLSGVLAITDFIIEEARLSEQEQRRRSLQEQWEQRGG